MQLKIKNKKSTKVNIKVAMLKAWTLLKLRSKTFERLVPLNFSKFSRISKQVDLDINFLKNDSFLISKFEEIILFLS